MLEGDPGTSMQGRRQRTHLQHAIPKLAQVAQRLARGGVPRRRDSRDEAERFYDASPVSAREETLTAAADIQPTRFHDAGWHAGGKGAVPCAQVLRPEDVCMQAIGLAWRTMHFCRNVGVDRESLGSSPCGGLNSSPSNILRRRR